MLDDLEQEHDKTRQILSMAARLDVRVASKLHGRGCPLHPVTCSPFSLLSAGTWKLFRADSARLIQSSDSARLIQSSDSGPAIASELVMVSFDMHDDVPPPRSKLNGVNWSLCRRF